jgi:hypothetical protein
MALSPSSSPSSPTVVPDPLPPGAVLAHVGIHKTGTTAIQSVLAQQREVLASHGVVYPGEQVNHHKAAMALTGTRWGAVEREGRPVPPIHWSNLVTAVRRTSDRVVISSEFFGDTRGANGERFRDELGPERLHVLIGTPSTSGCRRSISGGGTATRGPSGAATATERWSSAGETGSGPTG